MTKIVRLTLFKFTDASCVPEAVDLFATFAQKATKPNGESLEPYIIHANGIPTYDDPRSQGYNFATRILFHSKEDMDYYDNECPTHEELKSIWKPKLAGPPLVLYADAAAFMTGQGPVAN